MQLHTLNRQDWTATCAALVVTNLALVHIEIERFFCDELSEPTITFFVRRVLKPRVVMRKQIPQACETESVHLQSKQASRISDRHHRPQVVL